ncbi:L-arabinose transport system permease protein AraP [subsurface metagenome]
MKKIFQVKLRKKTKSSAKKEAIDGYIFILPWLLGLFIFTIYPLIVSFMISFTDWDIFNPPSWVGIKNYTTMFKESDFWQSIKVTMIYSTFAIPLGLMVSLILAMLLNLKVKGSGFFRTMVYAPAVISGVAASLLWMWIFNPDFGLINFFLSKLGIDGPQWLLSPHWALSAFVIMSLWTAGGSAVIYLAGLRNIPQQMYEAAEIDGANKWQQFTKITLPLLTPTTFFLLVMGVIGSFQIFTQSYVMTNGGPNRATLFYVLYLYNQAFRNYFMGYGCALGWSLFVIILIFTLLIFKSSPVWVYYESEREK